MLAIIHFRRDGDEGYWKQASGPALLQIGHHNWIRPAVIHSPDEETDRENICVVYVARACRQCPAS